MVSEYTDGLQSVIIVRPNSSKSNLVGLAQITSFTCAGGLVELCCGMNGLM